MNIQTLGIDIAKNVFQLHGVNRSGHVVLKRKVMRDQLLAVLAQIDPCTVAVEYGRLLLGAQVRGTRSSGEDHQPAICEAIRPQTEKRRQ
jgi:transposase